MLKMYHLVPWVVMLTKDLTPGYHFVDMIYLTLSKIATSRFYFKNACRELKKQSNDYERTFRKSRRETWVHVRRASCEAPGLRAFQTKFLVKTLLFYNFLETKEKAASTRVEESCCFK